MTRLAFSPHALRDIARLAEFLIDTDPTAAAATAAILRDGLSLLKLHPLVGHVAESGMRELVISRGRSGYVALYDYGVANDTALILAIRHQREGGFG